MPKLDIVAGATSVSVGLFIQDSSSTTGAGLTGLAFNTSSLTCYAFVPGAAAAAITLATLAAANSAWSSGGFKEVDATNCPGWYRFDIPNTNISTGRSVCLHFKGATNMAPLPLEISLTGWNNQDAVRGGLTALPNANAEAAGGLYTRGTGAGQIAQDANGNVRVNVDTIKTNPVVNGGTITFPTTATLASTTNITAATGVDITKILGTAISTPATAGILDVNTKNINNVAAATPGAAGGVLIAGSNAGTTTFGAVTCTGTLTVSDGVVITRSTGNSTAFSATGSGTGHGALFTSGNGASGQGLYAVSIATNGRGFRADGSGSGPGGQFVGGATAPGVEIDGGGTSGAGLSITTTVGDGLSILPTAGHAIVATANGTSKHGAVVTGGTAGTSDGLKLVAGTGGTDLRAAAITGTLATVTTATTATNLTTNNDKTGYTLSNTGMDNILDRAAGVETNFTLRQALRLILSAAAAKLSGAATTTVVLRDINDTKDRITATVDANGNRSAITTDVT